MRPGFIYHNTVSSLFMNLHSKSREERNWEP